MSSDILSISSSASRRSQQPASVSGPAQSDQERGKRIPEMATQEMAEALPRLPDDDLIGVAADHIVIRDGQPDVKFRGILLASVAPDSTPDGGRWRELRVYKTMGGKKIYSEVGRSLLDGERDKFTAFVDDSSFYQGEERVKAETQQMTRFFKFSDLAKKLYAKLGVSTEEIID
jgi:hypothetical protein